MPFGVKVNDMYDDQNEEELFGHDSGDIDRMSEIIKL